MICFRILYNILPRQSPSDDALPISNLEAMNIASPDRESKYWIMQQDYLAEFDNYPPTSKEFDMREKLF